MKAVWVLGLLVFIVGCNSSKSTTSGAGSYANYQENLSGSLPVYPDYKEAMEAESSSSSVESVESVDDVLGQKIRAMFDKNLTEPYFKSL